MPFAWKRLRGFLALLAIVMAATVAIAPDATFLANKIGAAATLQQVEAPEALAFSAAGHLHHVAIQGDCHRTLIKGACSGDSAACCGVTANAMPDMPPHLAPSPDPLPTLPPRLFYLAAAAAELDPPPPRS